METISSNTPTSSLSVWVRRIRLLIAIAATWAILHLLLTPLVFGAVGSHHPAVFFNPQTPWYAMPIFLVGLWLSTFVGVFVSGRKHPAGAIMIASVGMLAWTCMGGTMDDWLKTKNIVPSPPTGAPYWPLLGDYALLLVGVAGVVAIGAILGGKSAKKMVDFGDFAKYILSATATFIAFTAAAIVATYILNGRPENHTDHKQVIFSLLVAYWLFPFICRHTLHTHKDGTFAKFMKRQTYIGYWLSPFVVGVVGVVVAGFAPDLAYHADYKTLNIIPAWSLVRPLPIEMISVGLLTITLTTGILRDAELEDDE